MANLGPPLPPGYGQNTAPAAGMTEIGIGNGNVGAVGGQGVQNSKPERKRQRTKLPEIPSFFPELKTMSEEQLERLLTEEVALQV
jgi:hypothetical protein